MTIPFSLRQLEYFVAIAEHGNITRAADARNVAQPSVSLALSQLEAAIGSTLFRRLPGLGMAITPSGKRLLIEAKKILVSAGHIAEGDFDTGPLKGTLAISAYRDVGPCYLPRLMACFSARHPDVRFVVREGDLSEISDDLAEGRSELALTYDINVDGLDFKMRRVDEVLPHALLPEGHPLTGSDEIKLADLAEERLVLEDMPVTNEFSLSLFWAKGIRPGRILYVRSFEMQRGLIANGLGVGISCMRPFGDCSYDGRRIVCKPLEAGIPPQQVVMAHVECMTLSRVAEQFLTMF